MIQKVFDPLPPALICSCSFCMFPLQPTLALVSYPPLKKSSTTLMTLISNKKSRGEKREKKNLFVNST